MRKPHILFIDDETTILDLLKKNLGGQGDKWNMDLANSAEEALAMIEDTRYDVLVSDLKMPGKSGLELLEILYQNEHNKYLPLILLAELEETNLKRKAIELGAIDLLPKPVQIEDLTARINSILRLVEYGESLAESNSQLKEQLFRRQKLALVGQLSLGAFHDLNNMLTIVSGYSQMIQLEPEFVTKNMDQISESCYRASEFTRQILDFAKRSDSNKELHSLGEIIDRTVILLRRCTPNHINLHWTRPQTVVQLEVNQSQMIQLVMNLVLNIAHPKTDNSTIAIGLMEVEISEKSGLESRDAILPGRYLRLDVTDHDACVFNEDLEKLPASIYCHPQDRDDPDLSWDVVETIVEKNNGLLRVVNPNKDDVVVSVYIPVVGEI